MNARPLTIAILGLLFVTSSAKAQSFDLSWFTIDGGGATFSTGGSFSLGGTIGQPDASVMTGGTFTLSGGFWPGTVAPACDLVGDLDGDSDVDIQDLAFLLGHFGQPSGSTYSDGDIDADGDVDVQDLAFLLSNFGATCP